MNTEQVPFVRRLSLATVGDVMGAVTLEFSSPRAIQERRAFGCLSTTRHALYSLAKIGLIRQRHVKNERFERRVEFALLSTVSGSDDFELAANGYGDEREDTAIMTELG